MEDSDSDSVFTGPSRTELPSCSSEFVSCRAYKSRDLHKPDESRRCINERIAEIATKRGISMAQVALAWSLYNDFVTAPIVGTTKLESLKELIGGCEYCFSTPRAVSTFPGAARDITYHYYGIPTSSTRLLCP